MEIKQGDKVRVSKDAPKMYYPKEEDGIVMEIEGEDAFIRSESSGMPHCSPFWVLAIPTKYLVKVDAEAKEAKYKAGDKVRVKGSVLLEGGVFSIIGADYHEKLGWRYELNIHEWYPEIDLEPYTEPTDQTEAEKPNHTIKIPVEVDLTDSYWDAYAADLAKEAALKVANKYNDPEEAAEYAVSVAKAVVKGLKKK